MEIILQGLSKRFSGQWLFKNLDYRFRSPNAYAITGPNGSGKTTLLKIISGMMPGTSGMVNYRLQEKSLDPEHYYRHLTLVAPYMDLLEDLTLGEFLDFHFKLKPPLDGLSSQLIAEKCQLGNAYRNLLHTFSSGMKQRVKLATGFYTASSVLLLDEPTTNLDAAGIDWYRTEMSRIIKEKLVIIGSNQHREYDFCRDVLDLKGLPNPSYTC